MATDVVFDSDIQMWTMPDVTEDESELLAREANEIDVQQRAHAVAQEVDDEITAMQLQREAEGDEAIDWVSRGRTLLDELPRFLPTYTLRSLQRPRAAWRQEMGIEIAVPPWGVLLATDFPLGVAFSPVDMLRLRSTCYALRGGKTTAQFFLETLSYLGIVLRPCANDPKRLFELAARVFAERRFVHELRGVSARAVGLRADDPESANLADVAGSFALNRLLLLQDPARTSCAPLVPPARVGGGRTTSAAALSCGVDWTAGDIDVFVSCRGGPRSSQSAKVFKAVVNHASRACRELYLGAYMPYEIAGRHHYPTVRPHVKYCGDAYDGLSGFPAQVADALASTGVTYHRDAVLAFAADGLEPRILSAISRLPYKLGTQRPIHIERVAEVKPFDHRSTARWTRCSFGPHWPLPLKINVIQYSTRPMGEVLAPLGLVDAFDLVPSRVAMRVGHDLHCSFELNDETRAAIRKRELQLSKYAFGPAREASHVAIEEAVTKQIMRILKYEGYGFKLQHHM